MFASGIYHYVTESETWEVQYTISNEAVSVDEIVDVDKAETIEITPERIDKLQNAIIRDWVTALANQERPS